MSWPRTGQPLAQTDIEAVIRSHTITLELAKIPGLVQFFDELDQNQNLRTLMAKDPRRVLRQMQIAVPPEATITFHEFPKG